MDEPLAAYQAIPNAAPEEDPPRSADDYEYSWFEKGYRAALAATPAADSRGLDDSPDNCPTCGEWWPCHHGHLAIERVRYALSALYPWQSGPTNAKDAERFVRAYVAPTDPDPAP